MDTLNLVLEESGMRKTILSSRYETTIRILATQGCLPSTVLLVILEPYSIICFCDSMILTILLVMIKKPLLLIFIRASVLHRSRDPRGRNSREEGKPDKNQGKQELLEFQDGKKPPFFFPSPQR